MSASVGVPAGRLTAGQTGTLLRAGDMGWDEGRTPWLVNIPHQPVAVAVVRSVEDVTATIRSVVAARLRVLPEGTGHGASPVGALTDTVLIRTAELDTVDVDPTTRTAWVGAGARWHQVAAAASEHELAVQAGSAADVGVAGYLLSGGVSWLSRSKGLAVNDILAVEIVDAHGDIRIADAQSDPDLFWAVRGGGGGFGVVTRFRLRLHSVPSIASGTLFFPMTRAGEVLHAWRRWTHTVPDRTMSCGRLLQFPPLTELPDVLRGQAFAAVEVAHQGALTELGDVLAPIRGLGPCLDTVAEISAPQLADLHMDPPGPTPCTGGGLLLDDLPPSAIDALVACAGHGSGSPLLSVEIRHLGAAAARRPAHAGAIGHFDANYLMYAVGITPDTASTRKIAAAVAAVEQALSPWSADIQYANFIERTGDRRPFHDQHTLRRLQRVKNTIDPDDTFRSSHPIPAAPTVTQTHVPTG